MRTCGNAENHVGTCGTIENMWEPCETMLEPRDNYVETCGNHIIMYCFDMGYTIAIGATHHKNFGNMMNEPFDGKWVQSRIFF